jgi:cyclomaltodextrinase
MMNKIIQPGKYRHFKGKEYEAIGVAKHSETLEEFVVYRALYGEHELWMRPLKMFMGKVIVNGKEIPRFEFIGEK